MRQTPLNTAHRDAGSRLVDFAGWEMPLNYGSQLEEHHAVRRDAGMFDTSHVRGDGARDLLRFALANNVDKLREPGRALYSCLLREDGGILDDLIVYCLREDLFRVVVNAATADKDLAWFTALRDQRAPAVTLEPGRDLAMIAVQGASAREKFWTALPETRTASENLAPFSAVESGELFVARTGYTGEDGFELLVPAARAERLVLTDAQSVHRACASACGRHPRRYGAGRGARQATQRARREAAIRAARPGARLTFHVETVMNVPDNLSYTESHEWIRAEDDGTATIGITDHAQSALGDMVYVEVPDVAREVEKGEACCVVESVKAVSDVYAPFAGEVVDANAELATAPERVNQDPYGAWLFRLKPANPADLGKLLDAAQYRKSLAQSEEA